MGFFDIREVQSDPQRGTGDECVPPAAAYMGQRDQVLICAIFIVAVVVRDERKNLWGDPVYGRKRVLHGLNQTEYFQYVMPSKKSDQPASTSCELER